MLTNILERMLNKMKNDSKSGLKMQQILGVVFTLIILSTNIHAFTKINQNIQTVNKQNEEINTEGQIQVATQEREIKTSTRAMQERIIEEKQEEIKYITIEEIEISRNMDLTKRC